MQGHKASLHSWKKPVLHWEPLYPDIFYNSAPIYYARVDLTQIRMIEKKYGVRYVAEWPIQSEANSKPALLFWNKRVHPNGSNWLAVFFDQYTSRMRYTIRDGIDATRIPIQHTISLDGELVSSMHTNYTSLDGSIEVQNKQFLAKNKKSRYQPKFWVMPSDGRLEIVDDSIGILLSSS